MDYQLIIKKENIQFRKQNEYKWIMFAVSMFYLALPILFYFFFFPIGWFLLYFFFFHTSAHFNQVWNFQVPPKTPITLKAVDSVSPPEKKHIGTPQIWNPHTRKISRNKNNTCIAIFRFGNLFIFFHFICSVLFFENLTI